jgi:hypothetical protein
VYDIKNGKWIRKKSKKIDCLTDSDWKRLLVKEKNLIVAEKKYMYLVNVIRNQE